MMRLEKRHVDALAAMSELVPQLWDFVVAATDTVTRDGGAWRKGRGKCSVGTASDRYQDGHVILARPISLVRNPQRSVQLGVFYGLRDRRPCICGAVFNGAIEPSLRRPNWVLSDCEPPTLYLDNVALGVQAGESEGVWDRMRNDIMEVLRAIEESEPARQVMAALLVLRNRLTLTLSGSLHSWGLPMSAVRRVEDT